ncbi:unnamed protein product [Aspergillus oryzae var. brunneus]|uniref:Unnamed protein product n=2 Tax=Aspergillus oryzae TaxID=5062 RepID=A0AAN4YL16_ASPOZ|nr:unnamed protein product [Aspergillus oryzae]GMG51835.1 unnamed protein product [Aspergillus oryzae var. brunneus]
MADNATRVTPQGGILEGALHWPLSKIRQPRVIAEVIGGVILGPSVMGRIPGFTEAIFPDASIPNLNLVANLGLILFLFLVGLETDLRFLFSNLRVAASVSAAGMILPFGLGCAISYGLYNTFSDEPGTVKINFGTFLLFIGIAMAITGGFAIKLTEKIEDLVAALFLPLYFTLSGLQTNLGLLDTGLNIGLQANILSTRTFTMFVVMALVTTFVTTPLTTVLYPKWYQIKVDRWRRGEIDWNGNPIQSDSRVDSVTLAKEQLQGTTVRRLLVYLRLDGLSSICTLAALLGPSRLAQPPLPKMHPDKRKSQTMSPEPAAEEAAQTEVEDAPALQVHGVRLMELTDRDSSVMKVSEIEEYTLWDPVVNTFRAFGQWHDMSIMAGVSVVPEHSYADTVVGMAREESSDLLLIPWSETGAMSEHQTGLGIDEASRFANGPYTDFVSNVMRQSSSSVGVLIERSIYSRRTRKGLLTKRSFSAMSIRSSVWNSAPPAAARSHHIVLPFFGGDDDRFALRFVMQLAQNDQVTATIIHIDVAPSPPQVSEVHQSSPSSTTKDKSSSQILTTAQGSESDATFFGAMKDSLSEELTTRIVFTRVSPQRDSTDAVGVAVTAVKEEMGKVPQKAGNIVVVGRRNNRVDLNESSTSSQEEVGAETSRVLGAVAQAMVRTENRIVGDVLVLQAGMGAVGAR